MAQTDRRMRFSVSWIKALKAPSRGYVYWYDTKATNLALRISHTGRKVFVCCQSNGRRKVIPTAELESARSFCLDAAAAGRLENSGELTLGRVFTHWMEFHAKPHKRTWRRDESRFSKSLSHWRSARLEAISKAAVTSWHVEQGQERGHHSANDSLVFLSSLFNYATKEDSLGYCGKNPCRGVRRFPEHSRERYLTPSEMERFFHAVNALSREISKDFLRLAVFTGQRRQRVLEMKWDELDLGGKLWFIDGADNKSKRDQIVPLSTPAMEVLQRRKAIALPGAVWVLPSTQSNAGHYNDPKSAWRSVLKRSGLKNLRIHDLRRTLGSWMANGGENLEVIGKALGHRSPEATAVYARLAGEPVRDAVNRAAEQILLAGMQSD